MNLADFLDLVRPGLEPDLPAERKVDLANGAEPATYEEKIWCEWRGIAR